MKRKFIAIITSVFLVGCTVSQADLENAISQTLTAMPSATIAPTTTPLPTSTPTFTPEPTLTPTASKDVSATQQVLEEYKWYFVSRVKELFGDEFGCAIANWEEDSFDIACVEAPANDGIELTEFAYSFTYGLGYLMDGLGFDFCFDENFSLIVTLLSSNQDWGIRAITPGNVLRMILNKEIDSSEEWLKLVDGNLQTVDK